MRTITRQALAGRINSDTPPIVIEALPRRYYEDAHLPGAINIPHDEIEQEAATRLPDKQADIVVYCANSPCQNSAKAAHTLDALGYRNVYEYVEGKEDWQAAGLPLVSAQTSDAA